MAAVPNGLKNWATNETGSHQSEIIVRAEEALIVGLVLALWVAAIALFFNRWGKIRMLEPYQPKFIQQHRPSCPLVDQTTIQHRSFSKFNVTGESLFGHPKVVRPRQNSVFVGSSLVTLAPKLPRKVKSAFDLQHLVVSEAAVHKGTTATAVKITLDGPPLRRQSLLLVPQKNPATESSVHGGKERRLSFKDLVDLEKSLRCDRVYCRGEKELQKAEFHSRQVRASQSSIGQTRRNSIAFLDLKPFAGNPTRFPQPERRHSLFPGQKCNFSNARDSETKTGVADFRRNSALLSSSLENDRSYLSPRETVKSGVVDFRRNSMLIINNLTEDMGCRLFARNFSLGGSNMALASESCAAMRRDSGNAFLAYDTKQKTPLVKGKQNFPPKLNALHSAAGNSVAGRGKPSKSLDFGDPPDRKPTDRRNKKEIARCSFAGEITPHLPRPSFNGSSASLNTCPTPRNPGRLDGTRSTDDVRGRAPAVSRAASESQRSFDERPQNPDVPTVNVTSSLTNVVPNQIAETTSSLI